MLATYPPIHGLFPYQLRPLPSAPSLKVALLCILFAVQASQKEETMRDGNARLLLVARKKIAALQQCVTAASTVVVAWYHPACCAPRLAVLRCGLLMAAARQTCMLACLPRKPRTIDHP